MNLSKLKKMLLFNMSALIVAVFILDSGKEFFDRAQANVLTQTPGANTVLPRTSVAIVKSAMENATDIDYAEIKSMVERAVQRAGGLKKLIKDGDDVAIKPNLVTLYDGSNHPQRLPAAVNGITTDWRVTQAVVELVRQINPTGSVNIMEGSAGYTTLGNMTALNYTHQNIPGVDEFIPLEESGGWHEWNSPYLMKVLLPEGEGLYPDYKKPNRSEEFYLNKMYYEADVLISIPVLKNHYCTAITGAIKNIGIGATPANIYGSDPDTIWRGYGIDHSGNMEYLHKWIHDFYMCRPIDFVVMDGLQGLSNGPTCQDSDQYERNLQNMRLVLAGKDAIAVDAVASLALGINPSKVDHLVQLSNDHMGTIDPALIRIMGKRVGEIKKFLPMSSPGSAARYHDSEPPSLSVDSATIRNEELHLALSVDSETVLVEVAVDGKRLDQAVVGGFDEVTLGLDGIESGEHHIEIFACDRYLNCSSESLIR